MCVYVKKVNKNQVTVSALMLLHHCYHYFGPDTDGDALRHFDVVVFVSVASTPMGESGRSIRLFFFADQLEFLLAAALLVFVIRSIGLVNNQCALTLYAADSTFF